MAAGRRSSDAWPFPDGFWLVANPGRLRLTACHNNRRETMRCLGFAIALVALSSFGALAADITVFSPGIANGPLRKLASWTAETGNKVTITGGNVGRIRTAVNDNVPADLVFAPPADLKDLAAKLKPGSETKVGRIIFGIVVKKGRTPPRYLDPGKICRLHQTGGCAGLCQSGGGQPFRRDGGRDAQASRIRRREAVAHQGHDRRRHCAR